jgi:hypothetical protein
MAIYGSNGGVAVGQPISPSFGAQNGANAAAPVIQQPTQAPVTGGMQATGVQMSLLEACSRGIIPRNAMATAIAGVSCGAQNPTSIDDLMGNGAGAQANGGVAVNGAFGNPVQGGGVNNQQFVDGAFTANAGLSTGPAPTANETLTSAPVSAATTTANVTLGAGQFQG